MEIIILFHNQNKIRDMKLIHFAHPIHRKMHKWCVINKLHVSPKQFISRNRYLAKMCSRNHTSSMWIVGIGASVLLSAESTQLLNIGEILGHPTIGATIEWLS